VARQTDEGAGLGRVPPQDLDAEKAVLSSILLENEVLSSVSLEIKPDDFYHPGHRSLFKAMLALHDEQQPVDLLTLSDYLTAHKLLDTIGGPSALADVADFEVTAANVLHHARIVRDKKSRIEPTVCSICRNRSSYRLASPVGAPASATFSRRCPQPSTTSRAS
jgi:replicative DNA helicase